MNVCKIQGRGSRKINSTLNFIDTRPTEKFLITKSINCKGKTEKGDFIMSQGYIKLHRQLQECWLWTEDRFSRGQAWIDLLLMANHKDKKFPMNDEIKIIQRGQFVTSKRKLADKWKWNRRTVDVFLNLLVKDEMITMECTTKYTTITIINYDFYQYCEPQDAPPTTPQGTPPSSTNNNDKNEKKDIVYITRFEETYKIYPRKGDKKRAYSCYQARLKEGYSEDELYAATKNYADYCEREKRDQKYIKLATTFFGVNTPFVDYLPKQDTKPKVDVDKIFDIQEQYIAPYFGFPKEWFDGEKLVKDRVTSVIRPKNPQRGWYMDEEISVDYLINEYEGRRAWHEQNNYSG